MDSNQVMGLERMTRKNVGLKKMKIHIIEHLDINVRLEKELRKRSCYMRVRGAQSISRK